MSVRGESLSIAERRRRAGRRAGNAGIAAGVLALAGAGAVFALGSDASTDALAFAGIGAFLILLGSWRRDADVAPSRGSSPGEGFLMPHPPTPLRPWPTADQVVAPCRSCGATEPSVDSSCAACGAPR